MLHGGPFADHRYEEANLAADCIVKADNYFSNGDIDDPSNLANDPVYIFSGGSDDVLFPIKQDAQRDFY